MIYVYTANVKSLSEKVSSDEMAFLRMQSVLCEERRKKVQSLKQPADKVRSLGAGLLLQSALYEYLSLSVGKRDCGHRDETGMHCVGEINDETLSNASRMRKLQVEYGKHEKPYLPEYPGVFFNLSHSGDYVAVAISCHPVGIDIQEKKTLSEALQDKFFSEGERGSGKPAFYIFSGKESFIKLTGEGMSRSFADFDVDLRGRTVRDAQSGEILAYVRYKELDDGNYILCVCDKCRDIIRW